MWVTLFSHILTYIRLREYRMSTRQVLPSHFVLASVYFFIFFPRAGLQLLILIAREANAGYEREREYQKRSSRIGLCL